MNVKINIDREVMEHIIYALIFHHTYNVGCQITKAAETRERELFMKSIDWLAQFDKGHKVLVEGYKERLMELIR